MPSSSTPGIPGRSRAATELADEPRSLSPVDVAPRSETSTDSPHRPGPSIEGTSGDEPGRPEAREGIAFIVLLRGIACLLVVWDHLVATWCDRNALSFRPLVLVRDYVNRPLAISQDFGFLGVVLFFFVSGFIITHVAMRESVPAFAVKRLLRIFPPLIASIVIILLLDLAVASIRGEPREFADRSATDVLLSCGLVNYLRATNKPINGVAWTLVIEVAFYVSCAVVLPLLRKRPFAATGILTGACFAVIATSRAFGTPYFLLAASYAYLPLLLIGQATYLLWTRRIRPAAYLALAASNYGAFIYGIVQIHKPFYEPANSYGASALYGYLVFVIAMLLESRFTPWRVLNFYSRISYSLYLLHGAVGFAVLRLAMRQVGYPSALLWALAIVTGVAYLSWRFVERPSQHAARRLVRRLEGGTKGLRKNNFVNSQEIT